MLNITQAIILMRLKFVGSTTRWKNTEDPSTPFTPCAGSHVSPLV